MKKRFLPILTCFAGLTGCQQAPAPTANESTTAPAVGTAKPTLRSDQVDVERLKPAQGNMAPGVLVYDKNGIIWARVIKVDPDHQWRTGGVGGVLVRLDDDPKEEPTWWDFKILDQMFVLKN